MILCFRGDNSFYEKNIDEEQDNLELNSNNCVAVLSAYDELFVSSTLLRPEWIIPSTIADA